MAAEYSVHQTGKQGTHRRVHRLSAAFVFSAGSKRSRPSTDKETDIIRHNPIRSTLLQYSEGIDEASGHTLPLLNDDYNIENHGTGGSDICPSDLHCDFSSMNTSSATTSKVADILYPKANDHASCFVYDSKTPQTASSDYDVKAQNSPATSPRVVPAGHQLLQPPSSEDSLTAWTARQDETVNALKYSNEFAMTSKTGTMLKSSKASISGSCNRNKTRACTEVNNNSATPPANLHNVQPMPITFGDICASDIAAELKRKAPAMVFPVTPTKSFYSEAVSSRTTKPITPHTEGSLARSAFRKFVNLERRMSNVIRAHSFRSRNKNRNQETVDHQQPPIESTSYKKVDSSEYDYAPSIDSTALSGGFSCVDSCSTSCKDSAITQPSKITSPIKMKFDVPYDKRSSIVNFPVATLPDTSTEESRVVRNQFLQLERNTSSVKMTVSELSNTQKNSSPRKHPRTISSSSSFLQKASYTFSPKRAKTSEKNNFVPSSTSRHVGKISKACSKNIPSNGDIDLINFKETINGLYTTTSGLVLTPSSAIHSIARSKTLNSDVCRSQIGSTPRKVGQLAMLFSTQLGLMSEDQRQLSDKSADQLNSAVRRSVTNKSQLHFNAEISGMEGNAAALKPCVNESKMAKTIQTKQSSSKDGATALDNGRHSIVSERLSLLQGTYDGWKSKVEEKDTDQFTVTGKLSKSGKFSNSPLLQRKRQTAKLSLVRAKSSPLMVITPVSSKSLGKTELNVGNCSADAQPSCKSDRNNCKTVPAEADVLIKLVEVPQIDDEELSHFFRTTTKKATTNIIEGPDLFSFDLDLITAGRNDILQSVKRLHARRLKAGSRNPVRNIAERCDILNGYLERTTLSSEKDETSLESRKKCIQAPAAIGNSLFTTEALAGLASIEDFSRVTLRRVTSLTSLAGVNRYPPFMDKMLIHFKGRRSCQVRLVEPCVESVNSGDCFIFVSADCVHIWIGEFSNIIERSKAMEVGKQIHLKHDLGCKMQCNLIISGDDETSTVKPNVDQFLTFLNESNAGRCQDPGPPEEDDVYEEYMCETNIVYRLHTEQPYHHCLLLADDLSGKALHHSVLQSNECIKSSSNFVEALDQYAMTNSSLLYEVLVFDFGSEMYIWSGKHVPIDLRQAAIDLALSLWDSGYDYSEFNINPLSPLRGEKDGGVPVSAAQRPRWALFGKLTEGAETILFKEKFCDWPDASRLISVASIVSDRKHDVQPVLKPCDVQRMLNADIVPVSQILEGVDIKRGDACWEEIYDGMLKEQDIVTESVDVWRVSELDRFQLPPMHCGEFYDEDTYVVRWHYVLRQKDMRSLRSVNSNATTRQSALGRNRCAYFFWHGAKSSVSDQCACALMTVELDAERGPQIRVVQNKEPPCFIRIFSNRFIVLRGKFTATNNSLLVSAKRSVDKTNKNSQRQFIVRNELKGEAYLTETDVGCTHLRSRTSSIIIQPSSRSILIWHGAKSMTHSRARASELAQGLSLRCTLMLPETFGDCGCDALFFGKKHSLTHSENGDIDWQLIEMNEGDDCAQFRAILGTDCSGAYQSLAADNRIYDETLKLYHLTSLTGVFEATEVLNPCRNCLSIAVPFPVLQSDLYNESQPALFLIDARFTIYLWHGWWPDDSIHSLRTSSAEARFATDKKYALETALLYCQELQQKVMNPVIASVVYAGLEPIEFTNLFPVWITNTSARRSNLNDGKKPGESVAIETMLSRLKTKNVYTWNQIQRRPLPDGVDAMKLESYLSDSEFETVLGFNRDSFYSLPEWKQTKLKRQCGLF